METNSVLPAEYGRSSTRPISVTNQNRFAAKFKKRADAPAILVAMDVAKGVLALNLVSYQTSRQADEQKNTVSAYGSWLKRAS